VVGYMAVRSWREASNTRTSNKETAGTASLCALSKIAASILNEAEFPYSSFTHAVLSAPKPWQYNVQVRHRRAPPHTRATHTHLHTAGEPV
jgi:hypothetical protein